MFRSSRLEDEDQQEDLYLGLFYFLFRSYVRIVSFDMLKYILKFIGFGLTVLDFQEHIFSFHEYLKSKKVYLVYMYIGFHPYTLLLHIVEKLILIILAHDFWVLFLSKLNLRFNIKNVDISFIYD